MANGIDITQNGKVSLDMKTLVGIVVMIMSIATVYFSLQGKIAQLELDVVRMQDTLIVNTESSGPEVNLVRCQTMQYKILISNTLKKQLLN